MSKECLWYSIIKENGDGDESTLQQLYNNFNTWDKITIEVGSQVIYEESDPNHANIKNLIEKLEYYQNQNPDKELDIFFYFKKVEIQMTLSFGITANKSYYSFRSFSISLNEAKELFSYNFINSIRNIVKGHTNLMINDYRGTPTSPELKKIAGDLATLPVFGFNIHWWFIIPPKGHKERPIDHFESDDFLLEAPVYEAKKLDSGAIMIRLTEDYDFENVDRNYIDTYMKFREYLAKHVKM